MDCTRCIEELTAYLDGELGPPDSAQVKSHLAICASCAGELRSFQEAAKFVESASQELELPPGAWNAVRARISEEKSPSWSMFPALNRWRMALATLACFAILAFGYLWYQQDQERTLNAYMAQYIKAREASRSFQRAIIGEDGGFKSQNLAIENPFIEVKSTIDLNPFRSEDQ